jgi:hypothetical protein
VFNYPGGSFTLDLSANPIFITSWNNSAQINATIVGMPEGSSLGMLAMSGLVLFGALIRKSRPSVINSVC